MENGRKKGSGAGSPGRKRTPGRRNPPGRRRAGRLFFLLLLLATAGVACLAWAGWTLERPFHGYAGPEQTVVVQSGSGAARILAQLAQSGVIPDARVARVYLVYWLRNPPLQAGEYRFSGEMSIPQVLRKVIRGDVVSHPVTLVEGLTLEETAEQLARAGAGRQDLLLQAMRSPQPIADLDPAATDLEGYLFPETYRFRQGTGEREIVLTLVRTFRDRYARLLQPLLVQHPQPLRSLVTLASIVEKEAHESAERPVIAGVYRNRLEHKIGLDADPTIIFTLKRLGRWDGSLHKDDLRLDSPYNTYRHAGLPPGPICSPGLASLQAAAAPAEVPYYYFVSRNDGTHVFSATLAEHNRNVEIWQKRYWRERRAEEQRRRAGSP